jgi:hypothetical protein
MVTIRIPSREDYETYLQLKEVVTKKLGSDVCYTTMSLYKAFLAALQELPNADDKVEIKFLRQSVQVNMGCTFNYEVRKRRRAAESHEDILTDKHNLLPDVVGDFSGMNPRAKQFWIDELKAQGWKLEEPTAKAEGIIFKIKAFFHRIVKLCKTKWF